MKHIVSIVDYGVGNIKALLNIYNSLGIHASSARSESDLRMASRLILPGVGSFDWAMSRLNNSGLREPLDDLVINHNVPVLGICVGMQMMASSSEEGVISGLGWVPAYVKRLRKDSSVVTSDTQLRLPHMGWNNISVVKPHPLFAELSDSRFYFLHSYFFDVHSSDYAVATVEYGRTFTCSFSFENIMGVQFHPEKSHLWGVKLLENFARLEPC